jgi:hypothetical protein
MLSRTSMIRSTVMTVGSNVTLSLISSPIPLTMMSFRFSSKMISSTSSLSTAGPPGAHSSVTVSRGAVGLGVRVAAGEGVGDAATVFVATGLAGIAVADTPVAGRLVTGLGETAVGIAVAELGPLQAAAARASARAAHRTAINIARLSSSGYVGQ